jgi:hypothetical protein
MIHSTATVPVNPEDETPLTRAQVWTGLVRKALDARLFLLPNLCTRCEVVEESATHIVREATIAGDDLREIITFEPEKKVTFFQATGQREGAITSSSRTRPARCNCGSIATSACAARSPSVRKSRPSRPGWTATRATRVPCSRR